MLWSLRYNGVIKKKTKQLVNVKEISKPISRTIRHGTFEIRDEIILSGNSR